jgi:hypothetical protein
MSTGRKLNSGKGYYYDKEKDKWRAHMRINSRQIYLGHYLTEAEAHVISGMARNHAADFARFESAKHFANYIRGLILWV